MTTKQCVATIRANTVAIQAVITATFDHNDTLAALWDEYLVYYSSEGPSTNVPTCDISCCTILDNV